MNFFDDIEEIERQKKLLEKEREMEAGALAGKKRSAQELAQMRYSIRMPVIREFYHKARELGIPFDRDKRFYEIRSYEFSTNDYGGYSSYPYYIDNNGIYKDKTRSVKKFIFKDLEFRNIVESYYDHEDGNDFVANCSDRVWNELTDYMKHKLLGKEYKPPRPS